MKESLFISCADSLDQFREQLSNLLMVDHVMLTCLNDMDDKSFSLWLIQIGLNKKYDFH